MLFLVIQEHSPDNCPQREGLGPDALYGKDVKGVEVRFAVADVPGHRLTFLLEADSVDALHEYLEPGRTRATTTIVPVLDLAPGS